MGAEQSLPWLTVLPNHQGSFHCSAHGNEQPQEPTLPAQPVLPSSSVARMKMGVGAVGKNIPGLLQHHHIPGIPLLPTELGTAALQGWGEHGKENQENPPNLSPPVHWEQGGRSLSLCTSPAFI